MRGETARLRAAFCAWAAPVLSGGRYDLMSRFIQHGGTSCRTHCLAVAYYSLVLAWYLRLPCDRAGLVRGALLHDYFLYDWHQKNPAHRWHGFFHPAAALRRAEADFSLTQVERDVIARHMFPLTPIPPRTLEGALVCLVDKGCSLWEIFCRSPYPRLPFRLPEEAQTEKRNAHGNGKLDI